MYRILIPHPRGLLRLEKGSINLLNQYFCTTSICLSGDTTLGTNTDSKIKNRPKTNHASIFEDDKEFVKVRNLLNALTTEQRSEILAEFQYEEAIERKKAAEDLSLVFPGNAYFVHNRLKVHNRKKKLASWHWRSKFGRPTSVLPSTVDVSGTYCEIPQDWLMKKVAEKAVAPPSLSDLREIAVFNALPFVGFGFLDNVIMIVAGDYIDITIGTYLGISTMAAAALGNTISDLAGIGSAWYVEFLSSKVGVRHPDLTKEQQEMSSTRWCANIGRGIGVVLGCLLGMFPLMFLKHGGKKQSDVDDQKENISKDCNLRTS